jgi:hypothetical protein
MIKIKKCLTLIKHFQKVTVRETYLFILLPEFPLRPLPELPLPLFPEFPLRPLFPIPLLPDVLFPRFILSSSIPPWDLLPPWFPWPCWPFLIVWHNYLLVLG